MGKTTMKASRTLVTASVLAALWASGALAQEGPAVVFDRGGKHDRSFNQAAYEGAERFKAETGGAYAEFELQTDAQREQAVRRFAERGYNPVIAVGFSNASAVETVAPEFPDVNFAIIDSVVEQPNVRSVVFKEQEGSYLVGVLAAMASKSGKVGFVGGMDIPLIRKFACGYVQGVKDTNPDIEVFQNMTGTTPEAWNDQAKGAESVDGQIDRGAGVV
jgi:basic membrane protein A